MKKIALGFMAIAISFASIAQGDTEKSKAHRKGEGKEYRHRGGKGFEDMNLTDAQKAQFKTLNENFRTQMKSLTSDKSMTVGAQKEKRKALVKEHRSQMMALLTPEQKKQWERKESSTAGREEMEESLIKVIKARSKAYNNKPYIKTSKGDLF